MSNPLDAIYAKFEAMDNQDVPLEQYPQAAVNALACAGWAVVPRDLPSDVLGEAARNGTMETGNPKHVWDYMISKTRLYPAPKPDSTATGGDVERRARELLAAEYELMGYKALVAGVREFPFAVLSDGDAAAIRAIIAALSAPKQVDTELSAEDACEQFIAAEVDSAPEALRRLGDWLCNVLDEDRQKTASAMVIGAMMECSEAIRTASSSAARAAPQPVEAEGREAVAFVPVHPRSGPLWQETYPAGDAADGRLPHYPRMPLYTTPQPEQPAIDLEQFQWAANRWKKEAEYHANGIADDYGAGQRHAFFSCATELLAIIDGAKAGATPERTGTVADIPDHKLVYRGLCNILRRNKRKVPAWSKVSDIFGLGSTYAAQLLQRFNLHPDTGKPMETTPNVKAGLAEGE